MKSIILISLVAVLCTTAHAQDPVKTSPQYYKVLLENDQVRVLEYRLKAGEKEPMHSHSAGVVYVLSGTKLKFSYSDGRTEERAAAAGETIWRDPTTHAVENIGDTEPMPSLSISNLLDRTSSPDYMTTDHKLPTSGPLTSVLQPSRKATAWLADP
jgi:beta-alanine degradation protein BauB